MRVWLAIACAAVSVGCNRDVAPPKGATIEANSREPEGSLKPSRLRWDGSEAALNSSAKLPRLGWQASGSGRGGEGQSAYQVLVASDPAKLKGGEGDLWDSGKVVSSESINVGYGGPALTGRQRGVWTVRVGDQQDRASSYAAPAAWEIAPMDDEVEGDWIGRQRASAGETQDSVSYLRKSISVPPGFVSARLYITAMGLYEASINGRRVGKDVLTPGLTDHDKRTLVQRYEVGSLLGPGENVVGVVLAGGWCTARLGGMPGNCGLEPPRVRVMLEVTHADGFQVLESDHTWRYHDGPIRSARIDAGEEYDARLEQAGWDGPGFDDSDWSRVAEYEVGNERMVYHDAGPALRVAEEVEPRESGPALGVHLFDMGRPMAGWVRIGLSAAAGTRVSLRYGDELAPDGTLKAQGSSTTTDSYTAKGTGVESWEPRFALHRFRYVEVSGLPTRAALKSLVGRAVRTQMRRTGTLETSSPKLNQLFSSTVFALEEAFVSVPTSGRGPGELPGSLLQARAVALTGCLNRDVQGFYRKWLGDIRDAQLENGAYSAFAPGRGARAAGPSAAAAGVLVPWADFVCYADRSALDVHATSMGRWLDRVRAENPDFVWRNGLGSEPGDPLEGAGTDRALLATAELSYAAAALAEMLRHGESGLAAEAERYEGLSEAARRAFNATFVLPDGRLRSDTQTAYAVAIERGVFEGRALERAGEHLAAAIERAGRQPSTGLMATALLLPALSRVGRDDLAYALLEQMGEPGSTQHPSRELAFAGIGEWMYDAIGGIALDPAAPAGRHVFVRPRPGGGLTHAKASFDSAHGRIETEWKLEGRRFRLELMVPPGSSATVTLPFSGLVTEVQAGRHDFSVEVP